MRQFLRRRISSGTGGVLAILAAGSSPGAIAAPAVARPAQAATGTAIAAAENASARDDGTNDIVVTARRTDEKLQDVPIAVTALGGSVLDRRGTYNTNELQAQVPGLTIQPNFGRGSPILSLRGQGQLPGGALPAVVSYFAEVPDAAGYLQLFDLNSVQVLRGPQGTLFGRNSTGGAVLFEPNRPTDRLEAMVNARFGNLADREITAVVNLPVADWMAVRIAGNLVRRDGYTRNLSKTGPDFDGLDNESLRVSVLLKPASNFEDLFIFRGNINDNTATGQILTSYNPAGFAASLFSAPFKPFFGVTLAEAHARQQALGVRARYTNLGTDGHNTSWSVQNRGLLTLGNVAIKSILSYSYSKVSHFTLDNDATELPIIDAYGPSGLQDNEQFTAELQANGHFFDNRLDLTAGVYFERTDQNQNYVNVLLANPFIASVAINNPRNSINYQAGRSKALYAQGGYKLTDRLVLNVGLRHTWDNRYLLDEQTYGPNNLRPVVCAANTAISGNPFTNCATAFSGKFRKLTWNVDLDFHPMPDILIYLASRRGYKSGGLNSFALPPTPPTFGPETITDGEIGTKIQWRSGSTKGNLNLAAYYGSYDDIQRSVTLPNATSAIFNVNSATVKGIELETSMTVADVLTLSGFVSYTDPRFKGALSTVPFANTPKWTYRADATFHLPVDPELGELSVSAAIYGRSRFTVSPNGNTEPASFIAPYHVIDLRAGWDHVLRSNFDVALFAKNVADKAYVTGAGLTSNSTLGLTTLIFGEPRTYGVELRAHF